MKVEFSPEQYKKLINLVYLGNYMVNGVRTPEDMIVEYQELENYILSHASEAGLANLVSMEEGKACPSPALDMDDELNEIIGIYDEVTFMDELEARLEETSEEEGGDCCEAGHCSSEAANETAE